MKKHRASFLLGFVLFSIAPCFAHHLAVVVNKDSSVETLTSAQLAKILLLEERKWPGGREVLVVLHSDEAGETLTLGHLCGMSSRDVRIFVAGHKGSYTQVDSDHEVLRIVEATPGAVGLVDVRSINDQVRVLKVDGKLPMEEGYLPH
jgi:ABC-type phosphate transport system substrate-binding protein